MNKIKARNIATVTSVLIFFFCFYFGGTIAFKDQWPLYEALRATSSIIFAVIGAWLTILYPEALKKIFTKGAIFTGSNADSIELLISNIRYSSLILGAVLLVGFLAQIAKQILFLHSYASYLRAFSFGSLGALTFLQIWTLLMTLAQAEMAREDVNVSTSRQDAIKKFSSEISTTEKISVDEVEKNK